MELIHSRFSTIAIVESAGIPLRITIQGEINSEQFSDECGNCAWCSICRQRLVMSSHRETFQQSI